MHIIAQNTISEFVRISDMAVQKSKKSRSRRDMRRSHDSLSASPISSDTTTGSKHLRHHIAKDGFYRGKEIFTPKVKKPKGDAETVQDQ